MMVMVQVQHCGVYCRFLIQRVTPAVRFGWRSTGHRPSAGLAATPTPRCRPRPWLIYISKKNTIGHGCLNKSTSLTNMSRTCIGASSCTPCSAGSYYGYTGACHLCVCVLSRFVFLIFFVPVSESCFILCSARYN